MSYQFHALLYTSFLLGSRTVTSFPPYLLVTQEGCPCNSEMLARESKPPASPSAGPVHSEPCNWSPWVCFCPSSPWPPFSLFTVLQPQKPAGALVSKLVHAHLSALHVSSKLFSQPCNGQLFLISQVSDQMSPLATQSKITP